MNEQSSPFVVLFRSFVQSISRFHQIMSATNKHVSFFLHFFFFQIETKRKQNTHTADGNKIFYWKYFYAFACYAVNIVRWIPCTVQIASSLLRSNNDVMLLLGFIWSLCAVHFYIGEHIARVLDH